jgi:SLOG cluster3 family
MMDVFLSASVPLPTRDRRFFDTSDVLLIREALKALVEVVLPIGRITCGGHPAITPLLALFVREAELGSDRLTIYQSALFSSQMPWENSEFADVRLVDAVGQDRDASLTLMRREMIASRPFAAAVVIGGMDGVFEEVAMFSRLHPGAPILPVGSTGAAAAIVYREGDYGNDLVTNLTFASLFRRRLLPLQPAPPPRRITDR